MKRRLVLLLGLCGLALAALPPLLGQALPPGTELRLLSPDLKTLFAAWRLEGNRLLPLSPPLAPRPTARPAPPRLGTAKLQRRWLKGTQR